MSLSVIRESRGKPGRVTVHEPRMSRGQDEMQALVGSDSLWGRPELTQEGTVSTSPSRMQINVFLIWIKWLAWGISWVEDPLGQIQDLRACRQQSQTQVGHPGDSVVCRRLCPISTVLPHLPFLLSPFMTQAYEASPADSF